MIQMGGNHRLVFSLQKLPGEFHPNFMGLLWRHFAGGVGMHQMIAQNTSGFAQKTNPDYYLGKYAAAASRMTTIPKVSTAPMWKASRQLTPISPTETADTTMRSPLYSCKALHRTPRSLP